jgi:ferredoxin
MAKSAKVNPEMCIGCGLCVETCPEIFYMKDGLAVARRNQDCDEHDLEEVASECPVEAIAVEEDD